MVQKWDVLPLSAMAMESGLAGGGLGEPTGKGVTKLQAITVSLETLGINNGGVITGAVGSPPRQVLAGKRRVRPEEIVLFPPFILNAVAVSLWPSALLRQIADVCALLGLRSWVQQ